jgi:hypothetical protein
VIHEALGKFKRGEISKRQTLSIISDTLGSHYDLTHDLMKILKHQDSRWGPGDFDLPPLPALERAPCFLRPIHAPQMRLPSISMLWGSNRQDLHSVNPVGVTEGLDKRENYGQVKPQEAFLVQTELNHWCALPRTMFSLPLVPTPLSSPVPVQLTSSSVDHRSSSRSVSSLDYLSGMYLQHHQLGDKLQQARCVEPWERTDYSQARSNAGFGQLTDEHYFSNSQFLSRTVPYKTLHSENSRPHRRSESLTALNPYQPLIVFGPASVPEPSVLGTHYSMPIDQPAVHKSPPSLLSLRKRSREPSVASIKIDKRSKDNITSQKSEDAQDNLTAVDRSNTSQRNIVRNQQRLEWGSPFIHRLCGKGFASRAKVKKHHWGNRYDDLNTTTGCWFKHKKPNIRWDDHPSCKEELPTSTTLKTMQADSTSLNDKAPKHATIMPSNQFHSKPTLQDPSQAFAAAHKSSHTLSPYLQDCSAQNNVKQDGLLPYHTDSLTSKSPFENLLTAVNVAAKIEAPVPKGQNDSVVSRLDAQALTTERNEQHLPVWAHLLGL